MNPDRRQRRRGRGSGLADAARLVSAAAPGVAGAYLTAMVLSAAVPVGGAWLTKLILDRLVSPAGRGVVGLVALLAAVGLVAAALVHLARFLRAELDRSVTLLAQERLFAAVDRLPGLARFEDPGFQDHLHLARHGGAGSGGQLVDGGFGMIRGAITVVGFLIALAAVSLPMAGIAVAAAVPALVAEIALARRRAESAWRLSLHERREIFYAGLLTAVSAAKEVRLLGIGGYLRRRMRHERRAVDTATRALDLRELATQVGLGLLAAVVAGAGLLWAVQRTRDGHLGIGDLSVFIAAVAGVQASLGGLVGDVATVHGQLKIFGHFRLVVAAGPDLATSGGSGGPAAPAVAAASFDGIELHDVWFRYGDDLPWVLRGVTLRLRSGRATAVVGYNGAGKSTLVKLLCRFYDPCHGRITWNGVDLRDIPVERLRARIGAVFQDYVTYELTAAENIGLGDVSAIHDRRRIEAAAARAGVHDRLAALPRGYDTGLTRMFVSEADRTDTDTGVLLSGGEWQRVALARAFLRGDRELMVLDEPSSGLDAEAEHEIHRRLRALRAGRTSLLISHRLGALRDCVDHIVVLADGAVAEEGTHERLLTAGGCYARLFTLQAAGYRTGSNPRAGAA